jgi:hypothetical protein
MLKVRLAMLGGGGVVDGCSERSQCCQVAKHQNALKIDEYIHDVTPPSKNKSASSSLEY